MDEQIVQPSMNGGTMKAQKEINGPKGNKRPKREKKGKKAKKRKKRKKGKKRPS